MNDNAYPEELSQTRARLVISAIVVPVMSAFYWFRPELRAGSLANAIAIVGIYHLFTGLWVAGLRRYPDRYLWRRYVTIILDMTVVTLAMWLAGQTGAFFYPLYLWIIVGNGLRFGQRHLLFGIICGVVGFASMVWITPLWRANLEIATGLLCGILVLPLFYLSVLRRNKRLTAQLFDELQKSKVAEQAKGDFLANMSHEIRTPLNGVLGVAEIMQDGELAAEQRANLDIIVRSGRSLLNIINDILDFSKIASGRMTAEAIPFNLEQTIKDVYLLLLPTAEEKGIGLRCDIAANLPTGFVGDPTRLRQILFNLVGNGIKFTDQGEVTIRARRMEGDHGMALEVRDTGVGVPADRLEAIFEQFEQAGDDTARCFGGTGLGLAICRQLSLLMGGDIKVVSRSGEGSVFTVELPLPDALAFVATPAVTADRPEFGLHALVAEDNPVNRLVVRKNLERIGITCDEVVNGQDALDRLNDSHDLVFMDIRMPVMDGLESARRIREMTDNRSRIPIVALTADTSPDDAARSLANGIDQHLNKPFGTTDLVRVLTGPLGFRPLVKTKV